MTVDLLQAFKDMNFGSDNDEGMTLNGRVLIVDGMNTFIRSFAAIPTMDSNGNHIGGITGFLKSVGYAIRNFKPSRVFVVFDGKGGSRRRKKIYPEYKGERKAPMTRLNRAHGGIAEAEDEQNFMKYELVVLAKLLQYLPITIITLDYVEADDIIAYLAELTVNEGGEAIIYSTDKDFIQMVDDETRIKVWNPVRKKTYTVESVLEDYGIHPHKWLMYRAITGDKSDNIDGVKGVGIKTLLKEFPYFAEPNFVYLQQIEQEATYSKRKAIRQLAESRDLLERNLRLMQLADINISDSNKMIVLGRFRDNPPKFRKTGLTKELIHYNLLDAMGNYDLWVTQTFNPLTRFND